MKTRTAAGLLIVVAGAFTATAQENAGNQGKPGASPATPAVKPATALAAKPSIEPGKELKVGHAAPPLAVDAWVKGEALAKFETGTVYVIEFWATWCGPCLRSIPHLTELQKKHGSSLVIVGMASSEKRPAEGAPDERLDKLRKFVELQGDKMDYRIAYDSKRANSKAWLRPAGQTGIPCAFVVGADGKIAWFGNPRDERFNQEIQKALAANDDDDEPKPAPAQTEPAATAERRDARQPRR